jgi:hypothetical protein
MQIYMCKDMKDYCQSQKGGKELMQDSIMKRSVNKDSERYNFI